MDGRIARVDCREDAWRNENRRATSQTGIGAGGVLCIQRDQRIIPGEFEFDFRPLLGLHVGQAKSIPHDWADMQKSEFYEEWLNAMRLELDGHIEIGTFSADIVPKRVNVITAK